MKKKKILIVLPAFTFGGTVFSTLNMISFLRKDFDVTVLPMSYQGPVIKEYRDANINFLPEIPSLSAMVGKIECEPNLWRRLIFIFHKSLRRISSKIGFDYELFLFKIIANQIEKKYSFDYVASCQELSSTYFVSCFKRAKTIAWFRSEYSVYKNQLNSKERDKEQYLYSLFNKIVCVSNTTKDDFVSFFPHLRNKIFAIHNIQFTEKIIHKSLDQVSDLFPQNIFNIISVGRFAPQKRFSKIPKIASILKEMGVPFIWHIIGDGNMMGEYDETISAIERLGVRDCVLCHGAKLNPYPYIAKADLMVTPSYYEACPRVVIESKILHTPVICADFSSAKEFVKNDIDGYVVPIDNIAEYIAKMIQNKDLYNRIKSQCDKYFIDNDYIYTQLKQVFE